MIGGRKGKNVDDTRGRIRGLFEAADQTKAERINAEDRIAKLEEKSKALDTALPGLQEVLKGAEYTWRLTLGRKEAGEASAEDVAAAEKGIDDAQKAIDLNRDTLAGLEDLLETARNELSTLKLRAEFAAVPPWRAIADSMEAEVEQAASIIRAHYTAVLNSGTMQLSADVYLARTVGLGDVANIARQLEEQYRRVS